MRTYLIFVAAFIILTSCEKNYNRNLYEEAWKKNNISIAKEFIVQTDNEGEQANGNFLIAYIFKSQQQYDSALIYYLKALNLYEFSENVEWQAHTLKNIGNIHRENSNFKVAIEYYQRGYDLNVSEYINHEILLKIARTNWRIDEWSQAYDQLKHCLDFFSNKNDTYAAEANMILGNLSFDFALSSENKSGFDESFGYYFKAAELYDTEQDKARALNNIGNTYLEVGELNLSRRYLDSALHLQTDLKEIALLNHNYGKLQMAYGRFDSALLYFNVNIEQSKGITHEAQISYKEIIDHYIRTGQTDLALQANKAYFLNNQELIEERENLIKKSKEQEYQLAKNREVILDQLDQQQRHRLVAITILAFSMLVAVLVIYGVVRYRNRISKVRSILSET